MKKISRKESDLANAMIEPVKGCPEPIHFDLDIDSLDVMKLRGITGKTTNKDLSKEIKKIVHKYTEDFFKKDFEKRAGL